MNNSSHQFRASSLSTHTLSTPVQKSTIYFELIIPLRRSLLARPTIFKPLVNANGEALTIEGKRRGEMFRPEGSIDFFARNEYKRRERERERKSMKQIPRGAVSTVPFYVITRNQCPLFPFIPLAFVGKRGRGKTCSKGGNEERGNYRVVRIIVRYRR